MLSCSVNKQYEEWSIRVTSQEMVRMYKKPCRALEIIIVPGRGECALGNSLWSWHTLLRRNGAPAGPSSIQNSPPHSLLLLIWVSITAFGKFLLPQWPGNQQKWGVCVCVYLSLGSWSIPTSYSPGQQPLYPDHNTAYPGVLTYGRRFFSKVKYLEGKELSKWRQKFTSFKRAGCNGWRVRMCSQGEQKLTLCWFNSSKLLFLHQ